jgi:RNA-directed DNA polymerase
VATRTGALSHPTVAWHTLTWYAVHRTVRRLQARLGTAVQAGRWGKGQAWPHLWTHSCSGKALAGRRVTANDGRKPPGGDGILWDTPVKKTRALEALRQRGYRAQPLRRLYRPKTSNTKRWRPLSSPTLPDRALPALSLLVLDPIAATWGDPHSYGCRRARAPADAMEPCCKVFTRQHAPPWILEGDIRACFDACSPAWLGAHIPLERAILQKWLKAGFMAKHVLSPPEAGGAARGHVLPWDRQSGACRTRTGRKGVRRCAAPTSPTRPGASGEMCGRLHHYREFL